jgi:uncharacterized protein (TIGR00106 family)
MAIVAVSIAPVGEGISLHAHVAAALEPLRAQTRVRWKLDAMFTTLEGELSDVMSLVQAMHEAVFATGAQRVSTLVKIDDRRDRVVHMDDKVRAVMERTGTDKG